MEWFFIPVFGLFHILVIIKFEMLAQWTNYMFMLCFGTRRLARKLVLVYGLFNSGFVANSARDYLSTYSTIYLGERLSTKDRLGVRGMCWSSLAIPSSLTLLNTGPRDLLNTELCS